MGSMIISPLGETLAEEKRGGELAIADVDPFGRRACGDWGNWQEDIRARIYRERRPGAYGVLCDSHPPVMEDLPDFTPGPAKEIARMMQRAWTVGHGQFEEAEQLLRDGKLEEAASAFKRLQSEYPGTWFDRKARERLAELR